MKRGVTPADARKILLSFPGVDEGSSYGTTGFKVRGKFLARFRDEDTVLVIKCGEIERDLRLRAEPNVFFTTDHYRDYPTVLVRLDAATADQLRDVVEVGWERLASKRMRDNFHRAEDA